METVPKSATIGRERRRAIRRDVHTPAYASLNGSSQTAALELCEILNVSESGTCIQAPGLLKINRLLPLVLDFSETGARIHTAGHVVWAEASGKTGIRFPELHEVSLQQLRRWMSLNEAAEKTTHVDENSMKPSPPPPPHPVIPKPTSAAGYTSLIAQWAEIQKEAELFGPNLDGALQLIADRALALTWAEGAAIALKDESHSSDLVCVARAGHFSPELGAHLDSTSGFCGECIRTGKVRKCDDTEEDNSEEGQGLRGRGIRSLIACPIKTIKGAIIGVFEVFSSEPAAFWDNDARTVERLSRIVVKAVSQTMQSAGKPVPIIERSVTSKPDVEPVPEADAAAPVGEPEDNGRTVTLFATGLLSVVFFVWLIAPWISQAMSSFISPPKSQAAEMAPATVDYAGMTIADLRKTALGGSPTAQYAVAMRYASGDGVDQDYHEALDWFLKAAENGDMRAPAKIASCFWAGKGTPQDYTKAYFWGLLAQTTGDETGRVIVINTAPRLSDHRRAAEQQEADAWLRAHRLGSSRTSR